MSLKDSLGKISASLNTLSVAIPNIADDVRRLKDKLPNPDDANEAERIATSLSALADAAAQLAASTPDPEPEPTPTPTEEPTPEPAQTPNS